MILWVYMREIGSEGFFTPKCRISKSLCEELMLSNCGTREDSWESLGLQGDQISQS